MSDESSAQAVFVRAWAQADCLREVACGLGLGRADVLRWAEELYWRGVLLKPLPGWRQWERARRPRWLVRARRALPAVAGLHAELLLKALGHHRRVGAARVRSWLAPNDKPPFQAVGGVLVAVRAGWPGRDILLQIRLGFCCGCWDVLDEQEGP
jgi:hypothetical protein